jgi:hypothetical protein
MLFYARNGLGLDGGDQMLLVVLVSAFLAHAGSGTEIATIALAYAAAQLLLAYGASGVAKASSGVWRSGRAIAGITDTIGYGHPRVAAIVKSHSKLSWCLCWTVILFECLAPFLIFGGRKGALALIAAGILFHAGIALVMGLNVFLWSFAATYPALLFIADRIDSLLY